MTDNPHLTAAIEAGEIKQCQHCGIYWSPSRQAHECVESLRAELAAMTERAEAEYAGRQASDDMVHDYGKRLDEELANLSDARAELTAMTERAERAEAILDNACKPGYKAALDAARAERDAAMALLREAHDEIDRWDDGKTGRRDFDLEARIDAMLNKYP